MAVNGKQLLLKWNMLSHVAVLMSCATHIISPYLLLVGLLLQHVAIFNLLVPSLFLVATKQLYEWFSPSVCTSVRPSHLFDYVSIIVSSRNFQELLPMTKVTSMQKVKVRGQWSRSQRLKKSSNLTRIGCFRTVTPVWIHQWLQNDDQSLK